MIPASHNSSIAYKSFLCSSTPAPGNIPTDIHKRDKSIDEPLNELRFDVDRMNMIISNLLDVVQADNPENTVNAAHDGVRGVIGKVKNATE